MTDKAVSPQAARAQAMQRLMQPGSIAVIGASTDASKYSARVLDYLSRLGFRGPVYPIHPTAAEIHGLRCHRRIADVPTPVDVALIARPARDVPDELEACLSVGIRAFVVLGGGFAEAGAEGAALQERLAALCRDAGAVLCGPNCSGLANLATRATLTFMSNLDREVQDGGHVALVSNSGSIAAMVVQGRGRVFNAVVSTGNEAVLTSADYIDYAVRQPDTHAVVAFIEGIRDADALVAAAGHADACGKPLAILKAGRSRAAAEVAASHTGAMIDDDAVVRAVFERHRVIGVDTIEELSAMATLLDAAVGRTAGARVAVVTPSGGTAVLITDELASRGLALAAFTPETAARIRAAVPQAQVHNPMDVTGFSADAASLGAVAQAIVDDPGVDVVLAPMGGAVGDAAAARANALIDVARATRKLLVPIWQATVHDQAGYRALVQARLPVFTDHAAACLALSRLVAWQAARPVGAGSAPTQPALSPSAAGLIEAALAVEDRFLHEPEVKAILAAAGIAVPEGVRLRALDDVPSAAVSYPAVLKIVSRAVVHKSAIGGVAVVRERADLARALKAMSTEVVRHVRAADIDGYLLEEAVIEGGIELLVGVRRDARFGTTLTLAHGGVLANALAATAVTTLLPLSSAQAHETVRRFLPALPDAARHALAQTLMSVASVANAFGSRLAVLEINPLKLLVGAHGTRAVALDGVVEFNLLERIPP